MQSWTSSSSSWSAAWAGAGGGRTGAAAAGPGGGPGAAAAGGRDSSRRRVSPGPTLEWQCSNVTKAGNEDYAKFREDFKFMEKAPTRASS